MTPTPAMVEAAILRSCELTFTGPNARCQCREAGTLINGCESQRVKTQAALTAALAVSGYGDVVEALRGCVKAHETGRYEPVHIAYEAARAALARVTPEQSPPSPCVARI